jgi:hypothetical protein
MWLNISAVLVRVWPRRTFYSIDVILRVSIEMLIYSVPLYADGEHSIPP